MVRAWSRSWYHRVLPTAPGSAFSARSRSRTAWALKVADVFFSALALYSSRAPDRPPAMSPAVSTHWGPDSPRYFSASPSPAAVRSVRTACASVTALFQATILAWWAS